MVSYASLVLKIVPDSEYVHFSLFDSVKTSFHKDERSCLCSEGEDEYKLKSKEKAYMYPKEEYLLSFQLSTKFYILDYFEHPQLTCFI
jgi:hypothetical protein